MRAAATLARRIMARRPLRILGFAFLLASACADDGRPSPFAVDAGDENAGEDSRAPVEGSAEEGESVFGGPCLDDGQCDDGILCTSDACDGALHRCRFTPDDGPCQNSAYCDGVEQCDPRLGCRAGSPVSCNDGDTCTIDRCEEASHQCVHSPRDADGDGDPDAHCGGHDCDDADPTVSSLRKEICKNGKDDDCSGATDETGCIAPANDTCLDPLLIALSGTYMLDATAAGYDYAGSCALADHVNGRDVVGAIQLTGPEPRDVDVVAVTAGGSIALGLASRCADPSSEIACMPGAYTPNGREVARIRGRALGPGNYPLYVWTDRDQPISLRVTETDPEPKATNETCATASPIPLGEQIVVSLVDAAKDLSTSCNTSGGELVYSFALESAADVKVFVSSLDKLGLPSVSLRDAACSNAEDEMRCHAGDDSELYARNLPPGTYYLSVSATAPTDIAVTLRTSAPTDPPADETCAGAPPISANQTLDISLDGHTDDIRYGCSSDGEVDAAYDLELSEASDVLLLERLSGPDLGAVSIALPACGSPGDVKACGTGYSSPVRAAVRGLSAGPYRVVAESARGLPVSVTALVRPARAPTLVPFADTCEAVLTIAPHGGLYQGNTANAAGDYLAGCDTSGSGNAPDQMLKLVLTSTKRVVFDMGGSGYATLLDLRTGTTCPGTEVPSGCSVGNAPSRSFLDRTLKAGTYWVQVDGFTGDSGAWLLDVYVVDP
jgi:hypothetical protein